MNRSPVSISKSVQYLGITADDAGQRIDNFLFSRMKEVPKSHIYRILRKGEVRVNMKRISAFYKLKVGDSLRLPPLFVSPDKPKKPSAKTLTTLSQRILYEDKYFLIMNKPSGMSVHAGSTVPIGVIEACRALYPNIPQLELAHRLDSETSGCLILVKKKSILREIHGLLREGKIIKQYLLLTAGQWKQDELRVDIPLHKHYRMGGKHLVEVDYKTGKSCLTVFEPIRVFKQASFMKAKIYTGRTHQIRVHAQHQGHAIAGDDRYGKPEFNKFMHNLGLKRMFLHASSIEFKLPSSLQSIKVIAPLDPDLEKILLSEQL